MSFPLYRRPGGVVFLDDDPDYLEMLAQVMPPDWYVRLFLQPVDCIHMLQQEPPRWEADAWRQQEIINRWHQGQALIPQVLQYWRDDGMARFELTHACVVDYSMPAMSGLRVLSELVDWAGSRVLLTGRADEQLAVSAFNRGLIEQFIPKQSPDIRLRLTKAIQHLLNLPNIRHQNTWRGTLSREQHATLSNPSVAGDLDALARRQQWVEYVVIGAPFGVLALDSQGQAVWLQLEPADKLHELAEMAESQGWPAETVSEIRAGQKLIDLELQQALGSSQKPRPQAALALGSDPTLYAAMFPVDSAHCPGPTLSYERFLDSRGERTLQE